ncbi:MAG: hypothetical protein K8I30_03450 [Anaerolineae bacterium]|nr:hypothetical protein [Anaerolineae bacterium]
MRLWKFLIQRWRITYGIGLAFFIFYAVMMLAGEPSTQADIIVYTPVILRKMLPQFILCQAVFLVLGAVFYSYKWSDWGAGILMIVTPIIIADVVGSAIAQPAIGDTRLWQRESVRVGNHVYNLAGYHFAHLTLFECDVLSITCHAIYRDEEVLLSPHYPEPCHGEVALMAANNTVWLINDCETDFWHRPP